MIASLVPPAGSVRIRSFGVVIALLVGVTGAAAQVRPPDPGQPARPVKTRPGEPSLSFKCNAAASQKNLRPGSIERRRFLAECQNQPRPKR